MMQQYLNTREAAEYLGVSVSLLERYRQLREGPSFVRIGRSVRYRREDIDDFATLGRVPTSSISRRKASFGTSN